MVRGLRADYGKILLDFCDGTKQFEKESMENITTWCKHWDTDNFSDEYKTVGGRRTHKRVIPPASANFAGSEKGSDPPQTLPNAIPSPHPVST